MSVTINGNGSISGYTPTITASMLPAGSIIKVESTTLTDIFEQDVTQGTFSNAAMSVTITPSNANNKIFLLANCSLSIESQNDGAWSFFKNGSLLTGGVADAAGNRQRTTAVRPQTTTGQFITISGSHLDTAGSTSAITYSVRLCHGVGTAARYLRLNQSHTDANNVNDFRAASNLTAMEVAV